LKRKSLIEAVSSPEARDFIQAGTPKPQFVQADSKEEAAEEALATGPLETSAVEQRSEAEQPPKKRTPKQVIEEGEESPLPIRVPQTYRLPQRLVEDVARAAMERKIKRRKQ
jgi:hypothetical protein